MSFFQRQDTYKQDKPILAFSENVSYARSCQIKKSQISLGKDGKIGLPAGFFIARLMNAGVASFRPLPRIQLTAASATSSPNLVAGMPHVLLPGDVLYVLEPYIAIPMGTGAGTGTLSLRGRAVSITLAGSTAAENAIEAATLLNDIPYLSKEVYFVASGNNVIVFSKDGVSTHALTTANTSGTPFNTGATYTTVVNATSVGTVSHISTVNDNVVLTGNAGIALPAGTHLTTLNIAEVYGLYPHSIDFTEFKNAYDVGLVDAGRVYLGSLPYYDGNITYHLPEIIARYKW